MNMNVGAYLKRINYGGSVAPTAETLRRLQVAHLQTVPFENLSIHSAESITLRDEDLYRKIVEHNRGGFCYECNGLFAALLRALGFNVAMLSAAVAKARSSTEPSQASFIIPNPVQIEFGPCFDHMALMVTAPNSPTERWLVDVGFGDSFLEPLLLEEPGDQIQGSQTFRIVPFNDCLILFRRNNNDYWKPQYRFSLTPHTYDDYEEMCLYHQTSPDSHFTRSRICSRATADGRLTLSDMRLITTSGQVRAERVLASEQEYDRILREQFGIVMK